VEAGIYSSKRSLKGLFFHSPDFLLFQVASAVYVSNWVAPTGQDAIKW
jgi:hypothetical protein